MREEPPACSVMGFFRHPDYPGTEVHQTCGYTWHDHGWIDSRDITVCPSPQGPFPGQNCELLLRKYIRYVQEHEGAGYIVPVRPFTKEEYAELQRQEALAYEGESDS